MGCISALALGTPINNTLLLFIHTSMNNECASLIFESSPSTIFIWFVDQRIEYENLLVIHKVPSPSCQKGIGTNQQQSLYLRPQSRKNSRKQKVKWGESRISAEVISCRVQYMKPHPSIYMYKLHILFAYYKVWSTRYKYFCNKTPKTRSLSRGTTWPIENTGLIRLTLPRHDEGKKGGRGHSTIILLANNICRIIKKK